MTVLLLHLIEDIKIALRFAEVAKSLIEKSSDQVEELSISFGSLIDKFTDFF